MAGKKLYFLKVPKDFARKRHVRCMARKGASVAWAYLQILLETLETEGVFEYHADIFDSLADEIADVIDSDIGTVETMILSFHLNMISQCVPEMLQLGHPDFPQRQALLQ